MIDSTFYDGFEGEGELSFVSGDNKLVMWNGYFEIILDSLLDNHLKKEGILEAYFNHEGWYDDYPWLVMDIPLTINQLKCFDANKVKEPSIRENSGKLIKVILLFLQKNIKSDIYIEYD